MFGTKKKLMTAVVMLVISAIMMTSASYAWFTISTKPEVTDLTTQVVVNENLEIALAKTDGSIPVNFYSDTTDASLRQYTWGNVVDLESISAYTADTFKKTLRPVAFVPTTGSYGELRYPIYGSDGRVSNLNDLSTTARVDGFGNLKSVASDGSKVHGYYVDFWLKSNIGGDVNLLQIGDYRSSGSDGMPIGRGTVFQSSNSVLSKNISIAFKEIASNEEAGNDTIIPNNVTAKAVGEATSSDGLGIYKKSFTGIVTNLTKNQPKLIRMYIYLNGSGVTNASASSDGSIISGQLNVQFSINGVNNSMDGQP